MSENVLGADNQQATLVRNIRGASETIRQAPLSKIEILAYLNGALHDASLNKGRRIRFAQKEVEWLKMLRKLLKIIGYNSWIYKEGKNRNVSILETLCPELDFELHPLTLSTIAEQIAYLRGFFDAEGGIPHNEGKFYIQLVQKNYEKIVAIKTILHGLGIHCGKVHNPSRKVDPDYWRIFVSVQDHLRFAQIIFSWHPIKANIFRLRMKI